MAQAWSIQGPEPPEDGKGAAWITAVWPKAGGSLRVVITGRLLLGVELHWGGAKPFLCTPPACEGCERKANRRAQWYVSAYDRNRRCDIILTLPAGAAVVLKRAVEEYGVLRGLDVVLRRDGNGPSSRYWVDVEGDLSTDAKLRSEIDIEAAVARLFRVEQLPDYTREES